MSRALLVIDVQLHEAILVSQQMFISDVIDSQEWLERID